MIFKHCSCWFFGSWVGFIEKRGCLVLGPEYFDFPLKGITKASVAKISPKMRMVTNKIIFISSLFLNLRSNEKLFYHVIDNFPNLHIVWKCQNVEFKFLNFDIFYQIFVHWKCKHSSLRSQCWMRLFQWFSNTVNLSMTKFRRLLIRWEKSCFKI